MSYDKDNVNELADKHSGLQAYSLRIDINKGLSVDIGGDFFSSNKDIEPTQYDIFLYDSEYHADSIMEATYSVGNDPDGHHYTDSGKLSEVFEVSGEINVQDTLGMDGIVQAQGFCKKENLLEVAAQFEKGARAMITQHADGELNRALQSVEDAKLQAMKTIDAARDLKALNESLLVIKPDAPVGSVIADFRKDRADPKQDAVVAPQ